MTPIQSCAGNNKEVVLLRLVYPAFFSSYKLVDVRFDMMYLMQARIEEFVHKVRLLVCYKFSYLKCRAFERSCWLDIGKRSPGSMSGLGWAFKMWGITRWRCRRRPTRRWRWRALLLKPHNPWRRKLGALLMAHQPQLRHLLAQLAVRRGVGSAGPVRTSISKIRDFKLGVNHSPQMDLPGDSFQWKQSVDNIGKPKMHFGPESSL